MAKLRIAAVADNHYGKHSRGELHDVFADISQQADVLLLCGDLTDYGRAEEAEQLASDLRRKKGSSGHLPAGRGLTRCVGNGEMNPCLGKHVSGW